MQRLLSGEERAGKNSRFGSLWRALHSAHARRKFDDLNKDNHSPVALQAVQRIAWIYRIEREVQSLTIDERLAVRQSRSKPLWEEMHVWLQLERQRVPDGSGIAGAIDYSLNDWAALTAATVLDFIELRLGAIWPRMSRSPSQLPPLQQHVCQLGVCCQRSRVQRLMNRIGAQIDPGRLGDDQSNQSAAVQGSRNGYGSRPDLRNQGLKPRVRLADVPPRHGGDVSDVRDRHRRIVNSTNLEGARLAIVPDRLFGNAHRQRCVDDHSCTHVDRSMRIHATSSGDRTRAGGLRSQNPDPNGIEGVMDDDNVPFPPVTEVRDENSGPACGDGTFAVRRNNTRRLGRRREDLTKQSSRGGRVAADESPYKGCAALHADRRVGHPLSSM